MRLRIFLVLVLAFVLAIFAVSARADIFNTSAPTAATYAVIAQTGVSNASPFWPTVVTGDLAISPTNNACTGFVPAACGGSSGGTISGTINLVNPSAANAVSNAEAAELALLNTVIPAPIGLLPALGGTTLPPGIYTFTSSAQLTGLLTLAAAGNLTPNWIFEIPTTLTVGTPTIPGSVLVTDTSGGAGAAAAGVYWVVGSAILNPNAAMLGNIIAETNISFLPGAQDTCGRAFADTSVTFAGNNPAASDGRPNIISNTCAQSISGFNAGVIIAGGTVGPGTPSPSPVPEPGTLTLLLSGLTLGFLKRRKLR
jgi:hypothetical protein